jgi:hypothetical protein
MTVRGDRRGKPRVRKDRREKTRTPGRFNQALDAAHAADRKTENQLLREALRDLLRIQDDKRDHGWTVADINRIAAIRKLAGV